MVYTRAGWRSSAAAGSEAPARAAIPSRRPHPGLLRRERRALMRGTRRAAARPRRPHRRDVPPRSLARRPAAGALRRGDRDRRPARRDRRAPARQRGHPRCTCGAPVLHGSHFCPNCGRVLDEGRRLRARRHDDRAPRTGRSDRAADAPRPPSPTRCPRCGFTRTAEAGLLPRVRAAPAGRRRAPSPALRRRWVAAPRLVPGRLGLARARRSASSRSPARPSRSSLDRPEHGRCGGRRPTSPRRSATAARRPPAERAKRPNALAGGPRAAGRSSSQSTPRSHGRGKPSALAAEPFTTASPRSACSTRPSFASLHPGYYVVFSGVYGAADGREHGARYRSCTRLRRGLRAASRPLRAPLAASQRLFEPDFVIEKENICNSLANQVQSYAGRRVRGAALSPHSSLFPGSRQRRP